MHWTHGVVDSDPDRSPYLHHLRRDDDADETTSVGLELLLQIIFQVGDDLQALVRQVLFLQSRKPGVCWSEALGIQRIPR